MAKVRNKTLVPRNPFAVLASLRKAGAHFKSNKQLRVKARSKKEF